jgi:Reverse transcriptase (RNA-dependent DNA polymerase)
MRQPLRSDGTYAYPGQVLRLDKAQQGTADAGYRREGHRNRVCKRLGWTALKSEPSAYLICRGTAYARMLASTDDFIVASNCPVLLKEQREAFKRECNITLQDPVSQHAGVKIRRTPGYIELSVPKHIDVLLADTRMTDCNPATTPHLDGHDMSARKDDEPRQAAEKIKEFAHAVGAARFITDTVGYQIACAKYALAKHMADSGVRHWMALKKLLCRNVSRGFFRLANATACLAFHQEEPAARRRRRRSVASSDGRRGRLTPSYVPTFFDS